MISDSPALVEEERVTTKYRLGRWGHDVVVVCVTGACLAMIVSVIWSAIPGTWGNSRVSLPGNVLPWLVVSTVLAGALVLAIRRLMRRGWQPRISLLGGAIFLAAFGAKLFVAIRVDSVPVSDFRVMLEAGQGIAAGDWAFNQLEYFQLWGYQTGFAAYQGLVLKVTGPSTLGLVTMNALLMAGTNLMVFLFAHRMTGNRWVATGAAVAYLAYPGPFVLAPVLTNQHIGTCLLYVGLFLALKSIQDVTGWYRVWWAGGAGLALALSHLMRPLAVVAMLAVVVAVGLAWLVGRVGWKGGLVVALATVTVFYGVTRGADLVARASGFNPTGLSNNFPEWKLYSGLSRETGGRLMQIPDGLVERQGNTTTVDHAAAQALVRAQLDDVVRHLPSFLARKTAAMWAAEESRGFTFRAQLDLDEPYRTEAMDKLDQVALAERSIFLVVVALAGAAGLVGWRRRPVEVAPLLIATFMAGYFVAHLVYQVQPRFRYEWMPAAFAYASLSLQQLAVARRGRPLANEDDGTDSGTGEQPAE